MGRIHFYDNYEHEHALYEYDELYAYTVQVLSLVYEDDVHFISIHNNVLWIAQTFLATNVLRNCDFILNR